MPQGDFVGSLENPGLQMFCIFSKSDMAAYLQRKSNYIVLMIMCVLNPLMLLLLSLQNSTKTFPIPYTHSPYFSDLLSSLASSVSLLQRFSL